MAADPAGRLVPGLQDDSERVIQLSPPAHQLPTGLDLRRRRSASPSPRLAIDLAEQRPSWHNLAWRALSGTLDRTQWSDASNVGQLGSTPRRGFCGAALPCRRPHAVGCSRIRGWRRLGLLLRRDRRAGRVRASPRSRAQRWNRSSPRRQDVERHRRGREPDRAKAGPAAKVIPRAIPTTEVAADRSGSSRVLPALGGSIAEPAAYHIQQPILTSCLVGCGPDRIDRPPIALLPM